MQGPKGEAGDRGSLPDAKTDADALQLLDDMGFVPGASFTSSEELDGQLFQLKEGATYVVVEVVTPALGMKYPSNPDGDTYSVPSLAGQGRIRCMMNDRFVRFRGADASRHMISTRRLWGYYKTGMVDLVENESKD